MTDAEHEFIGGALVALINRLAGLGLDRLEVLAVIHAEAVAQCPPLAGHAALAAMMEGCAASLRAHAATIPDGFHKLAMMPVAGRA
jgi:hypothetical protein